MIAVAVAPSSIRQSMPRLAIGKLNADAAVMCMLLLYRAAAMGRGRNRPTRLARCNDACIVEQAKRCSAIREMAKELYNVQTNWALQYIAYISSSARRYSPACSNQKEHASSRQQCV